jgi:hypothetical protein
MNGLTRSLRIGTRTGLRLIALATAVALAGTIGVGSALAARPGAPSDSAAGPNADARHGVGRCAPLWLAARADPTVENWQAVGRCEIDRRLETLSVLQARVDASVVLTDAHERALDEILSSTQAGLRALRAEIEADTTLAELREDITSIFEAYRVYALVVRQVWLVIGDDTVDVTADGFDAAADRLEAAIDAAEAAGKDIGDAREHLAAMIRHVEAARDEVEGDAEAVLALTPADWNDESAQPVLREARQSLADARGHLRSALAEARQVLAEIKE